MNKLRELAENLVTRAISKEKRSDDIKLEARPTPTWQQVAAMLHAKPGSNASRAITTTDSQAAKMAKEREEQKKAAAVNVSDDESLNHFSKGFMHGAQGKGKESKHPHYVAGHNHGRDWEQENSGQKVDPGDAHDAWKQWNLG